jgi:hypothetical protein
MDDDRAAVGISKDRVYPQRRPALEELQRSLGRRPSHQRCCKQLKHSADDPDIHAGTCGDDIVGEH